MSLVDPPGARRHRSAAPARTWRGMSPWLWSAVILAIVAGIAVILILAKAAGDGTPPWAQDSGVRPVVPAAPTAAPPTADLPEGAFVGDGVPGAMQVYEAGLDIEPGTYTTPGALSPERPGWWEVRHPRGESGLTRHLDGGDNVVGPVTVTLNKGDQLRTRGMRPWAPSTEDESDG